MDIEEFCRTASVMSVPDHLKWVAEHTKFEAKLSTGMVKKPKAALGCVALLPEPDKPDPFTGLTTSDRIVNGYEEYSQAFAEVKNMPLNQAVGIYNWTHRCPH